MASTTDSRLVVGRVSVISITLDLFFVGLLGLAILFAWLFGVPYERGFFCDDDSIKLSYKKDTVTNAVLISLSLGIPAVVILTSEGVCRLREGPSGRTRRVAIGRCTMMAWVAKIIWTVTFFLFGLGAQQAIVDAGKYTIGRLRPHFLAACQPSPPFSVLCANTSGSESAVQVPPHLQYITEYTCLGLPDVVREARLSFPSGHSSVSFYSAVFCAVYLWKRFSWRKRARLQLGFLQLVLIVLAWLTALSRITDHKHHWSDVLTGIIIGTLVALITVLGLVKPRASPRVPSDGGDENGAPTLHAAPSCDTYETLFVI